MAIEKDDFRRVSVIWEFRVTGNWVAARVASRVKWAFKLKLNKAFFNQCFSLREITRKLRQLKFHLRPKQVTLFVK